MQQNRLMKMTTVYAVLFAVAALAVIFHFSSHKTIVVTDLAQDEVLHNSGTAGQSRFETAKASSQNEIIFDQSSREMNYFCIPMPESTRADAVTVENHYMDRELWVSIRQNANQDKELYQGFYQTTGVYGNREAVKQGVFENGGDVFWLKFELTDVYEYRSIFEDHNLYIEFVSPKEVYDRIVVIDPAYGGEVTGAASGAQQGKDITLAIARALKGLLDETDIKVYYTRMDDSYPMEETRAELTNAAKADMLIRIEVNENGDTKIYGTEAVYNSKFFIPGFGSIELADLLEREVVTAISGKANGLVESTEEDEVVNMVTVPAAAIRVGYISNGQESILLNRDDYIDKIANGIYQTILTVYEEYEPE